MQYFSGVHVSFELMDKRTDVCACVLAMRAPADHAPIDPMPHGHAMAHPVPEMYRGIIISGPSPNPHGSIEKAACNKQT